jgi:multisubunit Na+/H+ antiporter MnhC subunit
VDYLEAIGFLLLLVAGVYGILPLRKIRFYLSLLIASVAVGAFVMGYGYGSRDAVESIAPSLVGDAATRALSSVQPHLENPLWGAGVGLLLVAIVSFCFRRDLRDYVRGDPSREDD